MSGLPHAARPCPECPWRRDAQPGKFPPERYEALACTSRRPDAHGHTDAPLGSPMFACHMTPDGREHACAGWLAIEGRNHIGVRIAVVTGALDPSVLTPGPGWPALYDTYADLAAANAHPTDATP